MSRRRSNLMTQKDYAKLRGWSPQYVSKLKSEDKVVMDGKLVDVAKTDAAIKAFQRTGNALKSNHHSQRAKGSKGSSSRTASKPSEPRAPRLGGPDTAAFWRRDKEKYDALNRRLEYEKNIGVLLPRDQVLLAERMKNERIRSMFRALPRSLAPQVAHCTSAAEAENLLRSEIDSILQRLADDPLGMSESAPVAITSVEAEAIPVPLAVQTPAPEIVGEGRLS